MDENEKKGLSQEQQDRLNPKWKAAPEFKYNQDGGALVKANALRGQRVVAKEYESDGLKEAQVPFLPYERWIDPQGNVCNLVVNNNRGRKDPDSQYGHRVRRRKEHAGWLPYDDLPRSRDVKARDMGEWVKERDSVIQLRRERHSAQQNNFGRALRPMSDILVEGNQKALSAVMNQIVDALKSSTGTASSDEPSKRGPGRPPKDGNG